MGGTEQVLPRTQIIDNPCRLPWVRSTVACEWNLEARRLVADKISLKKMDCLVAGLLERIFPHAWRVMRLSSL